MIYYMEVLNALKQYWQEHKSLPSYAKLTELLNVKSKNTAYYKVEELINRGLIKKLTNGRLTPTKLFFCLPYFESIQAGFPQYIEDNSSDISMTIDEYLIDHPLDTFLIKVRGDSMEEKGIFEGDIVLVRRGIDTKAGDIVVAMIDEKFTLKILKKEKNKYFLSAANKKYPDMIAADELQILGKVVGSIRKY